MSRRPLILATNDDGIDAPGLAALVSAVAARLAFIVARFSSRDASPAASVHTAPTAAPSVGENRPP